MIIKFRERVYNIVKRIPRGNVTTYSAIARAIGNPKAVRAVGNVLSQNLWRTIPCHRVINSDGKTGDYNRGPRNKIKILRKEGVKIKYGKVDLVKFGWEKQYLR